MRGFLGITVSLLAVVACSSGKTSVSSSASSTTTKPTSTSAPKSTSAGCASSTTVAGSDGAREVNPPGDIPDDQAFVTYTPPTSTYTVSVPEGWARTQSGGHVTFTDKLNTIDVDVVDAPSAPTVASAKAKEVPTIARTAACFELVDVTTVTRTSGQMVVIRHRVDSAPDPVTGKVLVDDVERYETWNRGKEAVLTLSGPAGSDNVDPWKTVTDSFRWR
jgi:hypothetical protein